MNLQEIRKTIAEFEKKHPDAYSKVIEEKVNAKVKFVELLVRFKVDNTKENP